MNMENPFKEWTSYREFEIEANRDPEGLYCPVKFGGIEWPEGKPYFKDSDLRYS